MFLSRRGRWRRPCRTSAGRSLRCAASRPYRLIQPSLYRLPVQFGGPEKNTISSRPCWRGARVPDVVLPTAGLGWSNNGGGRWRSESTPAIVRRTGRFNRRPSIIAATRGGNVVRLDAAAAPVVVVNGNRKLHILWQLKTAHFWGGRLGRSGRSPGDSRQAFWGGRRERSDRSSGENAPRSCGVGGHGATPSRRSSEAVLSQC